jgi:hypothetical protein
MPPRTRTTTRPAPDHHDDDEAPTRRDGATDSGTKAITLRLPTLGDIDAKRLLWYGGLGALATIGILDWPVALVVGTGTIIATRSRRSPTPTAPRREN